MKCPKCNHEGEERDFYDHYGDYECPICGYIEGERKMNDREKERLEILWKRIILIDRRIERLEKRLNIMIKEIEQ